MSDKKSLQASGFLPPSEGQRACHTEIKRGLT